VRVGAYDREYDSSGRDDEDGFHWEVDIEYKPRTYSSILLHTRRVSEETNGLGSFIDTNEYGVSWEHKWSLRSWTKLGMSVAEDDYVGSDRTDDRYRIEASYTREFRRWLDLSAGYRYENRDSDTREQDYLGLDYSQNLYFLTATLSL
jgi:uncharacterized protein (PEP-CTERM system associated)